MIEPAQSGERLLTDVGRCTCESSFSVWWLGQSGYLVKSRAGLLLLDPYLSDSLTIKYAGTDKPHIRMTSIPVRPDQLTKIDVVTSSHNHTDHLDADTLCPLMKANERLQMVIPEANRQFVADRIGCDDRWPLGAVDQQSITAGGFVFHGIASAHDSVDRNQHGQPLYMGYVVTFGPFSIYHSGDTLWHPELVRQLAPFDIDLAMLPINGKLPRRRVAGNLWGQEAAQLANDIGARLVLPCHYDMFTFNTETTDAFEAKCRELDQPYKVSHCGERLDISVAGGDAS